MRNVLMAQKLHPLFGFLIFFLRTRKVFELKEYYNTSYLKSEITSASVLICTVMKACMYTYDMCCIIIVRKVTAILERLS